MGTFRVVAVAVACAAALLAVSGTAGGAGVSLGGVKTSAGFAAQVASLHPAATYGAFVQFNGGTPLEHDALLARYGLTTVADFHSSVNAVFAAGTVSAFRALTFETAAIKYLEEDRTLRYHGETAVWATRARVAQEWVAGGPFVDGTGRILDGNGIGVAVIDSGINAAHPDLEDRVAKNYKIVCAAPLNLLDDGPTCVGGLAIVDVGSTNSDITSGHGTHVAGIVSGDGRMSTGPYPVAEAAPNVKGTFTGVAPGSTIFGYSTGEVISVLYSMEAWQHLYDNYDNLRPRIRVANHSFGDGPATYDPNSMSSQMVNKLVAKGITMVFSAGNDGTEGDDFGNNGGDITSSYCDNPTPGVICVANYDDAAVAGSATGTGNRNGSLNASSSRGKAGAPATYPDISAPGTWYTAACIRGVEPVCALGIINEARWGGFYGTISGTSMSAPHVAGIAALLLNARPALTPAQVEDVLQDTAHKFRFAGDGAYEPDPQNSGATTSYDKGAGLADVPAALKALNIRSLAASGGGTPAASPAIRITSPANGATLKAAAITVTGTANDGSTSTAEQPVQWITDGDGGDYAGPGAADIAGLSVQETAGGLTYRLTVRDAADLGPAGAVSYRVTQNVNGLPFQTNVGLNANGVTLSATGAVATSGSRSGNTITFFVPYANLGNPPANSPAHNAFVSSFIQLIQDYAPSPNPSTGAEINTRPMAGKPYTIVRPQAPAPPGAATVKVQLDGGSPVTATLSGSSPSYTWTAQLAKPKKGTHTIKATLFLGGVEKATDTVSITVK